eukprot:7742059-Lingulodinium_polyedra.AAC.1
MPGRSGRRAPGRCCNGGTRSGTEIRRRVPRPAQWRVRRSCCQSVCTAPRRRCVRAPPCEWP